MPENQIAKLVKFVNNLDRDPLMPMPVELRECEATLIPKRARPNVMKHLRPIAGLHDMKQSVGLPLAPIRK